MLATLLFFIVIQEIGVGLPQDEKLQVLSIPRQDRLVTLKKAGGIGLIIFTVGMETRKTRHAVLWLTHEKDRDLEARGHGHIRESRIPSYQEYPLRMSHRRTYKLGRWISRTEASPNHKVNAWLLFDI